MTREQSNRMFNEFCGDRIVWKDGYGAIVAEAMLARMPLGSGATVMDALNAVGGAETLAGRAMIHGLTQKIGDAAALGIENGRRPTMADKGRAMEEVIQSLYSGEWNAKRSTTTLLYEALCRLAARGSKKAAEYASMFVGMDEDTKKQLMKSAAVKDEIQKIRDERNPAPEGLIDDL